MSIKINYAASVSLVHKTLGLGWLFQVGIFCSPWSSSCVYAGEYFVLQLQRKKKKKKGKGQEILSKINNTSKWENSDLIFSSLPNNLFLH